VAVSHENVDIVRRGLELFRDGDVEGALALGHPEMVSRRVDPDGAVFHGHDGLLQLMADWTEGFDEWSYRAEEYVDADDHVVVHIKQWGTGAGSGARVESDNWIVYAVEDGLITRVTIYGDRAEAYAAARVAGG
jgi:ketosteroid isomerase-like protein